MADRDFNPLPDLLHELAESLQASTSYLNAARRAQGFPAPAPHPAGALIDKAAREMTRAQAAFRRIRYELSGEKIIPQRDDPVVQSSQRVPPGK